MVVHLTLATAKVASMLAVLVQVVQTVAEVAMEASKIATQTIKILVGTSIQWHTLRASSPTTRVQVERQVLQKMELVVLAAVSFAFKYSMSSVLAAQVSKQMVIMA